MLRLLERLVRAERRRGLRRLPMVPMLLPFSRPKAIGTNEWWLYLQMIYDDPVAFDLLRMQHAGFPSCLRFSFTRNKLEKSRKPSSPACACLGQIRTQIVANQAPAYAEAALRTF